MENSRPLFYIIEAEFNEFRGFVKPRIKLLEVEFKHKLQILNSTNGCGKSTFISELNPFAINKTLFKKNGYKRIRFKYGEKTYEVYSSHKTNKLIDLDEPDNNLCTGGTISQLQTLVETMFNITPFSWAIAMGSIEFTASNKDTRRRWIELISGIDLDYPFKVLGRLSSESSGCRGVYKHLNAQYATEASKLIKYEDVEEAMRIRDVLTTDIKDILMARDTSLDTRNHQELKNKIVKLETTAKSLYADYGKLDRVINPFSNLNTLESIREAYRDRQAIIDHITVEINGLIRLQEDKNSILKRVQDAGSIDIDEVRKNIKIDQDCLKAARASYAGANSYIHSNLKSADAAFSFSGDTSRPVFNFNDMVMSLGLEENSFELIIDEQQRAVMIGKLNDLEAKLNNARGAVQHNEDLLTHLKDACRDVDCPQCHTTFQLGGERIEKTQRILDQALADISKYEPQLSELTIEYEAVSSVYGTRQAAIEYLSKAFEDHQWYVRIIKDKIEEGCGLNELGRLIEKDSRNAHDLRVGMVSTESIKELEAIAANYEKMRELTDYEKLDEEVNVLSTKIAVLRKKRTDVTTERDEIGNLGKLVGKHIELLTNFRDTLTELEAARREYLKVMDNHVLSRMEHDLQLRLAAVTKRINDRDILVNLTDKLSVMLEDAKERMEVIKVLEKAMNTTTGIIGEQLGAYTKSFAEQMTDAISQLWGYPMRILPCSVEGKKGMNYLFPFDIGGDEPVPDVANGSKSQCSVINLAVMLCTRMSLGLDRLPLFLDEVGGGFDTTHNLRLGEFIRMLLSDYDCSNIFLVHHDIAVRNMLGPHDTVVFDASQVVVETGYNENVKLTYYKD